MNPITLLTAAEQVAGYLRERLADGRLRGEMPGVLALEKQIGVNRNTLEAALKLLEAEGWLEARGAGKPRSIVNRRGPAGIRLARRIGLLVCDAVDRRLDFFIDAQHELSALGHTLVHAPHSLAELGMDPQHVAPMVAKMKVDAWIVHAGSQGVLEWFVKQGIPVLAIFGRWRDLPIAAVGVDKPPVFAAVARHLIAKGHSRIVLLTRALRRMPQPGASERAFLEALAAAGVKTSDFHLPDWEETVDGLHARLETLFRITPPTALIVDEAPLFIATQQFLARKHLRVPEDVSLVCADADPHFDWCKPSVAHMRWEGAPVTRRVIRWVNHISHGKKDMKKTLVPAKFVAGGTVGAAH